ncbi:MAG: hypothetical protein ABID64_03590 [Nitrospirota bacterium]
MGEKSTNRRPQSGSSGPRPTVPAKPVAPAAGPSARASAQTNINARKKVDPSKDLIPPKEKYPESVRKMPGKWGEYARAAVDIAKENGMSLNDPMVRFAMVLCAFMGKYAGYVDLIPGNFRKSLDKDELSKEELTKAQKTKLRERMLKKVPKDIHDFFVMYKAENDKRIKDKKPALNATETSTMYVSSLLFGASPADCLTDHKVLAARLSHEYTDQKRTYGDAGLSALKKMDNIPRGTVIFFAPSFKTGIIAAYATGNRKKFVYFVPGSKDRKSFQLDAPTSPIKNELGLMAAFVPTNLQGAAVPAKAPVPASATVSTNAPAQGSKPKPAVAPVKAPVINPEALTKTLDTTVDNTVKQVNEEIEKQYLALKDKKAASVLSVLKVADILSTSIEKVEDAAKKAKLLKSEQYAKIKEKHENALRKYHDFVETVNFKLFVKNFLPTFKKLTNLPAQTRDKLSRDKLKKLVEKGVIFFNPYLNKIREYEKRSKNLLPKSASK